jgi:hypothetical protein
MLTILNTVCRYYDQVVSVSYNNRMLIFMDLNFVFMNDRIKTLTPPFTLFALFSGGKYDDYLICCNSINHSILCIGGLKILSGESEGLGCYCRFNYQY